MAQRKAGRFLEDGQSKRGKSDDVAAGDSSFCSLSLRLGVSSVSQGYCRGAAGSIPMSIQ